MDLNILSTGDKSHTVYSEKYSAHYHSIHGALEESIHVFISAGLYHLTRQGYTSISILEMGFGTGLNALLTALESSRLSINVCYETIESDPIPNDVAASLNYSSLLSQKDIAQKIISQLHQCPWNEKVDITSSFNFNKINNRIEDSVLSGGYDLIYYDAFAPSCQAQLWQEEIHQKLYNLLNPGGVLVTYCTQGAFRRTLESIGYKIERLNGPGKKREMMRATKVSS